jgi:hypothetical protein
MGDDGALVGVAAVFGVDGWIVYRRRRGGRPAGWGHQARTVERVFVAFVLGLMTGRVPSRRRACEIVSHLEGETGDRGSVERTVRAWLHHERARGSRPGHDDDPGERPRVP